jgi:hypothetical protein
VQGAGEVDVGAGGFVGALDLAKYGAETDVRGWKVTTGGCIGEAILCSDLSKGNTVS